MVHVGAGGWPPNLSREQGRAYNKKRVGGLGP